jgi:hypothetical protein
MFTQTSPGFFDTHSPLYNMIPNSAPYFLSFFILLNELFLNNLNQTAQYLSTIYTNAVSTSKHFLSNPFGAFSLHLLPFMGLKYYRISSKKKPRETNDFHRRSVFSST